MLAVLHVLTKVVLGAAGLLVFAIAFVENAGIEIVPKVLAAEISQVSVLIILVTAMALLPIIQRLERARLKAEPSATDVSSKTSREKYAVSMRYGAVALLSAAVLAAVCIPLRAELLRFFVQLTDLLITALFAIGALYLAVGSYGLLFGKRG